MREKRIYGIKRVHPAPTSDADLSAFEGEEIAHGLTCQEAEVLRKQFSEQHPGGCYFITVSELRFR